MDSAVPHLWVSAIVGVVELPVWGRRQSEGGLSGDETEGVVRASTRRHPTSSCARRYQSGESQERTVGVDVTHIPCSQGGWAHFTAVIDGHYREVFGYEFPLRSRAKEAERAVEAACFRGLGRCGPRGPRSCGAITA